MAKLTVEGVAAILRDVSYPGMDFNVGGGASPTSQFWLQIKCDGRCNVTGVPMNWVSRKWMLSAHMTKSEVVQTAFKAVMTAVEHETREQFIYKGAAIFGPHFNVDHLVTMALKPNAQDVRLDP